MSYKDILSKLGKEALVLTKEAAVDKLLGEVEQRDIKIESRDNRIDVLKLSRGNGKSISPKGKTSSQDKIDVVKNTIMVIIGTLASGSFTWEGLGAAFLAGVGTFFNRRRHDG